MSVRTLALALGVTALLAACGHTATAPAEQPGGDNSGGASGGGGDSAVAHPDPAPDPNANTFCGRLGYHCDPADVDPEVATRSQTLLDELGARVDSGESNEAAASWISQQDGVVDVSSSPSAIVFRVQGGQPTWLLTPLEGGAAPASPPGPSRADVVGHGTARDNPDHDKKALVLLPFLFQFKTSDPGPAIAAMLQNVRDYAGGVRTVANNVAPTLPKGTPAAGRPTVEDFEGWNEDDVIFVSTHGAQVAEGSWGCKTFVKGDLLCLTGISTGQRVADCGAYKKANYAGVPGVRCAGISEPEFKGQVFLLLDTDFFSWRYSDSGTGVVGLNKAVVYISGCNTYTNWSLAYQLGGSRSDYFGMEGSVYIDESAQPAVGLFARMLGDGLSTTDAYDDLENDGGTETSTSHLRHYPTTGNGLHIREVTTIKNPMDPQVSGAAPAPASPSTDPSDAAARWGSPGADLQTGDVLPFIGQPGDGVNDELFLYVDVDGIEPGTESDYDVTIAVNGEELGTWPLNLDADGVRRVGDYAIRLRILQPLDFDVEKGQTIKLEATAHLPGDGDPESHEEVDVQLANPTLHFHSTIESKAQDVDLVSEVEGDVDLHFEPGDTPDELRVGTSTGTLSHVRFDATMPVASGCTQSTSTVDGRLGIIDADIPFQDPESADFGVPNDLVLKVYPEIDEILTVTCAAGSTSLDLRHWFSGFLSFHSGAFGGTNEVDESKGGLVITDWQPGSGDVFARKTYERTGTEEEGTFIESTSLEIRGPSYGPGSS